MTARSLLMHAGFAALALSTASAAIADGQTPPAVTRAPCVAKPISVGGAAGLQLCGPASATVTVGARTYTFTEGFCAHDVQNQLALQLSLGADIPVFGAGKPNHGRPLFILTLSTQAQTGTLREVDFAGRKLVPEDTTITAHYSPNAPVRGTFSGRGVTGTWNCHGGLYKLNQP